jgi:L-ascorbate metabolism protein UlaG (beta-lactamase superfamily)
MTRGVAITFVGTATTILEVAGLRLLTDPVLDPPGARYGALGGLVHYTRLAGPSIDASRIGPIDAVLLSHDQHGDNLDAAGRALLPSAGVVLTTRSGAHRLERQSGLANVVGLLPGEATMVGPLRITAAPARHGPVGARLFAGDVIGFFVEHPSGSLYVSGDTVWHSALARFARTRAPDLAIVHAGAAKFALTGGLRLTCSAADVARFAAAWPDAIFVPVHYEGWSHFSEGRDAFAAGLARRGLAERVRWIAPGAREAFPCERAGAVDEAERDSLGIV